ncbi:hypothetical protein LTR10_017973 [Elasticomyces elasticus]|uniref:NAD(P)-binding domain-containing protein n=1 Tax=Exophiala sideris TaxID=1016849 RepID=A0ABR0JBS0_9EURO|nr:hypothetical protein LTR10_017973 [Elasticomyces elasticus]KAK5026069.1 hypothetical protein LTS07_007594 [Exophiala sideris]KAK5032324.1 hypothetical protein LTR13_007147 [Exophiala sideris]KAK5059479.1 hypothetical protein LTR69_006068 [Exophiala sideris]KAK5186642.1 hypothetical protein LTR44_000648 [Eurotiomycetes sp. CCFEE 6388]
MFMINVRTSNLRIRVSNLHALRFTTASARTKRLESQRMVHLILTGATGLVGSAVLSHILSLPNTTITRLSILSRNPSIPLLASPPPEGTPHANKTTHIEVISHQDFNTYSPEILDKLNGAEACIWALGVSQNDVSKDEYVQITRDFTLSAARAFSSLPSTTTNAQQTKFRFVYVSGMGATQTPGRFTPLFGRVKGETETALLKLAAESEFRAKLCAFNVRPAAVDGRNQPWLWRGVLRDKRSAAQRVYLPAVIAPIKWVGREGWLSPTEELGRVLVDMALDSTTRYEGDGVHEEGTILDNVALRRLGKEGVKSAS